MFVVIFALYSLFADQGPISPALVPDRAKSATQPVSPHAGASRMDFRGRRLGRRGRSLLFSPSEDHSLLNFWIVLLADAESALG